MILADKIIMLRKKCGWSQEELASRLGISRQSVSKWESTASVPDLDKIIKLSQLFGVSTDYLLKDELEELEPGVAQEDTAGEDGEQPGRMVTLEEANQFLDLMKKMALRFAISVSICIMSPIVLLLMGGLAENGNGITEDQAGGIGVAILLVMIAGAVASFIWNGMQLDAYKYLETDLFSLQYGIAGMVEKKKEDFTLTHRKCIAGGVLLCILSVVPLMCAAAFYQKDMAMIVCVAILLFLIACGVFLFVWSGMIMESYQKLLQEGDYTTAKKAENKKNASISGIYWCTVTAVYLGVSFYTMRWDRSWIIWPCAGVFFAAVCGIASTLRKSSQ